MAVYKRGGSPFYYADFKVNRARIYRSTGCTTEREARAEERRLKTEARAAAKTSAAPGLTLNRALELYWQEHGRHLAPRWAAEVDRYCAAIVKHMPPDLMVSAMTDADINDFAQSWDGGSYAFNRALAVLRGMHGRARKRWRQATHVIEWGDYVNEEEERIRWITLEEAMRLVAALSSHIALAVEWSLYTGCRKEETFSLTWTDVHMDRGYAVVTAKGGKRHTVWLSEQALDVLARSPQQGACVFDRTNQQRLFMRGLRQAGIGDFRWHDLRHTFATWMRQAGAPLEVVQRALGHTKLSTTERYAHVADAELQEAMRKVPSIVPSERKIISIKQSTARG